MLRHGREVQATVARAVERGWVIVRDDRKGRTNARSASLTDQGRRMARKSLQ
jgi:hypothetical protein